MVMKKRTLIALAAAVAVAGCSGPAKGPGAVGEDGSAKGRRTRDDFEARRDPPISADTRYAAGRLAEEHGSPGRAAEQYRLALKLDPNHLESMYRLAVVYAGQRKYDDAIGVWKRYAAASNGAAGAYSNLGFCYELAGRPEEAEAAYRKGIEKDPRNEPCRVNYGLMLVRRGRVGEGKSQLQAVLQPAEVHYNVGSVYESLGQREQARAEYRQALSLDPALADAQTRLRELEGGVRAPAGSPAGVTESGFSQTE